MEKSKVDEMGEFGIVDHELIRAQYLESNKAGQFVFVSSDETALELLTKTVV